SDPFLVHWRGAAARKARRAQGAIAQLVERLHGMQEVWGSNPHSSTCSLCRSDGVSETTPKPFFDLESRKGAKRGASGHADLASFAWLKMVFMVAAPLVITGLT